MKWLHHILVASYLLIPAAVGAWLAVRAVRSRSFAPLKPLLLTALSAAIVGGGLVAAYALLARGVPSAGQVLLTAYLGLAVLLVLKGLNWLLREAAERALRVRGPGIKPLRDRPVRATLAVLARVVVLFAVGLPYVMAVVMVYRPKVVGPDPATQFGLAYEPVTFHAADGTRLHAWWVPAAAPLGRPTTAPDERWGTRTVILCHGLGAGKSNQLALGGDLPANGYNVLAIDFRAHGSSGGQLTTFGDLERLDVLAAVRWVRENRPAEARRVYGLGVSMGAAALVAAAADDSDEGRTIEAVAVYATYDDLGSVARTMVGKSFGRNLGRAAVTAALPIAGMHAGRDLTEFAPSTHVKALAPRPILVIHGRRDQIIAVQHGRALYDAALQPKRFHWVEDADHNGVLEDGDAMRAVRKFFDDVEEGG